MRLLLRVLVGWWFLVLVLVLGGCGGAWSDVRPCGHYGAGVYLSARTVDAPADPGGTPPDGPFRPVGRAAAGPPDQVVVTVHNGNESPVRVLLRCGQAGAERDSVVEVAARTDRDLAFWCSRRYGVALRFSCEVVGWTRRAA